MNVASSITAAQACFNNKSVEILLSTFHCSQKSASRKMCSAFVLARSCNSIPGRPCVGYDATTAAALRLRVLDRPIAKRDLFSSVLFPIELHGARTNRTIIIMHAVKLLSGGTSNNSRTGNRVQKNVFRHPRCRCDFGTPRDTIRLYC